MSIARQETAAAAVAHKKEHHRDVKGGAARAAVFGVSDGLLTNVSLILGVAGANTSPSVVRLAGLAGLVAGAFSMAAGEYISMSAQSELIKREVSLEREEIRRHPESERRELVNLYVERGLSRELSEEVATGLMRDPEVALDIHSREELGIDPDSTGSPLRAAVSSFIAFAVGALVPLLPWFVAGGPRAVLTSVLLGTLAALGIGAATGYFTGRSIWRTALRQLVIGAIAAGVTYGIGSLVGVKTT
ncbi:MAG: VIT1/CCC1 transporter family protein [Candidatus Dormibacteria bacterium]